MPYSKLTIVQGNELIEGAYKVSLDEFRLLNLVLSKVDSKERQPNKPYVITVQDFQSVYGLSHNNGHTKLRDSAKGLLRKPIVVYRHDEKTGRLKGTERPWFSFIEYDVIDGDAAVSLIFSEFVRPYIYELKKNFTSVIFRNVSALDTAFSIRLYYWLAKPKKLFKSTRNGTTSVKLDIDWIKQRAGLEGKYDDYRIFRRKLIEPAINKINAETDITVTFEPLLKGKRVTGIEFIYVDEKVKTKPSRNRLPRRPHVTKESHAEGLWARECLDIMSKYELELCDAGYVLEVGDLRKMQNWYKIIGDDLAIEEIEAEITKRISK